MFREISAVSLLIITVVLLALLFPGYFTAYGHDVDEIEIKYKEKTCSLVVHKGELAWCYFGDDDKPIVRQNLIEIKNNPHIIDQFLYFLETGISRDED